MTGKKVRGQEATQKQGHKEQKSARTPKSETVEANSAEVARPKKKPHGRDEVIESIIDATLDLWSAKGPAELSMRSIAARAEVNYGLVHRHFGTKEAVIRAAMERVVTRSFDFVKECDDLESVVSEILPRSTGAHARLLAWATLQYVLDDVLPEKDEFLEYVADIARRPDDQSDSPESALNVASLIALLYGWRLFEPYLLRGLDLEGLSRADLDAHIQKTMRKIISSDS
ncbi:MULTISPECIES: TetR/AcrR family transcriptional regulator [unclassified Streptomyces]|uniref:TetR/AcrR family transcriptional regulator n=1 Tax=unclassified Streptomyces TaxID=2593676 RepID=UPI003D8EF5C7